MPLNHAPDHGGNAMTTCRLMLWGKTDVFRRRWHPVFPGHHHLTQNISNTYLIGYCHYTEAQYLVYYTSLRYKYLQSERTQELESFIDMILA